DVNFLATNGYLSVMPKEDYDRAVAEVTNLAQMNDALLNEMVQEGIARAALAKDERKTHSILFHLEGRDEKEAVIGKLDGERGSYQVSNLRTRVPEADFSQLWNVSIGLAKLRADQSQINQSFLLALGILHHFDSTLDNKMMAAEIITSLNANSSQSSIDNSDL